MAWPTGISRSEYKAWKAKKEKAGINTSSLNVNDYISELNGSVVGSLGSFPRVFPSLSDDAILQSLNETADEKQDEDALLIDNNDVKVIKVDSQGLYGIVFYKYGVETWQRSIYKRDTVVTYPSKGGAMEERTYKAGEYSKWALMPAPYRSSIESALKHIGQDMLTQKIIEADSVKGMAQMCADVGKELNFAISRPN